MRYQVRERWRDKWGRRHKRDWGLTYPTREACEKLYVLVVRDAKRPGQYKRVVEIVEVDDDSV